MTLTDEQLDALADRLRQAWSDAMIAQEPYNWAKVAREAARWAEEQQGEVVWEWKPYSNMAAWHPCNASSARNLEAAGETVRAIRVIATTTKEPSHE